MNKNLIIGIVALVIIVGGISIYSSNNAKAKMMENATMMQKENEARVQKEKDAMMQKDQDVMVKDDNAMMAKAGSYESYSAEKIAMAETGDVVLFFHAPWCPSCRALNSDIEKNVDVIPAGVTILKTDYDKETELKKKYGVTTQHTLVQVDKDGNLIKKWSGGSKLENLLSQIQ